MSSSLAISIVYKMPRFVSHETFWEFNIHECPVCYTLENMIIVVSITEIIIIIHLLSINLKICLPIASAAAY